MQFAHTALLPVHSGASIKALSLIDAILNAAPIIQEARGLGDAEIERKVASTGGMKEKGR
ncbi:hypothetical protein [Polaromonas sp.]|uniref:hypothetical protein n=1 Tax=Polaromonas sp. TaxID=1869339 RepID=UPI0025D80056|nr:hypothetical protein [Polaromonas sp.]